MAARASDLPYLIVGVVLGSVVLIIVAFIPFCLWRAWSKQSECVTLSTDRRDPTEGGGASQPPREASARDGRGQTPCHTHWSPHFRVPQRAGREAEKTPSPLSLQPMDLGRWKV